MIDPPDPSADAPTSRAYPGFFSSASTFALPEGTQVSTERMRGYYIDMRAKAYTAEWPWPESPPYLHIGTTQWGLGSFERFLAGEGERWLAAARHAADELVGSQVRDGTLAGGWVHTVALPHTYRLRAPWLSAMAQGEGASLLVRLYLETDDERYADAARRALLPLGLDSASGGVRALLGGAPYPEEYPTSPGSFVLNGGIFAMWGVHDVGVTLNESATLNEFHGYVDTLATNLDRWDLGYWSRYDLFPHVIPNVASSFYHDLHVKQLRMTHQLAPRQQLLDMAERWALYSKSATSRRRALANKALFRLMIPRNRFAARWSPWSHAA